MNKMTNRHILLISIVFLVISCNERPNYTLFEDLPSTQTGVKFINEPSNSEHFNMIDYLYYYDGGGVAVGDINDDGLSDIYLVSNEGDNALYLNKGDMKFQDITETAGVKSPGLWKTGVSMVDVNGDGLLDLYLCRLGDYKGVTGSNELYINQGNMTFKEEAAKYNLDFVGFSTQAAFFDMDNDGDLDVYLLNHSVHTPGSFGDASLRLEVDTLAGDRLYRNDNNVFQDVSSNSGIYRSQIGYGLGVVLSDINQDGYTDIFIANDFMENDYLYLNNRDGTFTDHYAEMADHTSLSSMGSDMADFNNDGLIDIITLDMLPEDHLVRKSTVGEDPLEIFRMKLNYGYMAQYKRNTLQLNRGDGSFSDIAMMAGIHATDWSWAPLFADFDNDGWKDLFISNGIKGRPNDLDYLNFIESETVVNNPDLPDSVLLNKMPSGKVSNYFYRNNGDLTFIDSALDWGITSNLITQGVAYSDLDNDGDLDLVLNNLDTKAVIKQNNLDPNLAGHFLSLDLRGGSGNTMAIGSKVEVFHGNEYQFYELFPVRGFKSSVDYRLHIGLGDTEVVDSINIKWPEGAETKLYQVEVDRMMRLTAPESLVADKNHEVKHALFDAISNQKLGVNYVHQENTFIEFNREPLLPHMHSQEGPALAVADVNRDGLDDFFIGGAKHQQGSIYFQAEEGFRLTEQPALALAKLSEDVDASFFDFDKDGDQDLIVVSGGNEFVGENPNRQPSLYLNNGKGDFTLLDGAFNDIYHTGSCVAVYDFDHDGWQDLFLGSLVVPWNYGLAPQSYLLKNDQGKSFIDVSQLLPESGKLGMINDAEWVDLDGSGKKSLVLVGEWMDITILSFDNENFHLKIIPESSGWWKTISHVDYDNDGDQDLLAGNLGLNSKLKVNDKHEVNLYLDDFDQNGKLDAVMTSKGKREFVFPVREMLEKQIPSIGSKFPTSRSFAEASTKDLFGERFSQAARLSINEFRSGVFINDDNEFQFKAFPQRAQISVVREFLTEDLNNDGSIDILLGGNLQAANMQEGRYMADRASIIEGAASKQILSYHDTGLSIRGDVRKFEMFDFQGKRLLLVARNNNTMQWFILE